MPRGKKEGKTQRKPKEAPPVASGEIRSLERAVVERICTAYHAQGMPIFIGVDVGEVNCGVAMFVPYIGEHFTRPATSLSTVRIRLLSWMRFGFDKRHKDTAAAVKGIREEFAARFPFGELVTLVVVEAQLKRNSRMMAISGGLRIELAIQCPRAIIVEQPAWQKFSMCVWLPRVTPADYHARKRASYDAVLEMLAADTSNKQADEWISFVKTKLAVAFDACDALWTAYGHMIHHRQTLEKLVPDEDTRSEIRYYLDTRERCNQELSRTRQRPEAGGIVRPIIPRRGVAAPDVSSMDDDDDDDDDDNDSDDDSDDSVSDSEDTDGEDLFPGRGARRSSSDAFDNDDDDDDDDEDIQEQHQHKKSRNPDPFLLNV